MTKSKSSDSSAMEATPTATISVSSGVTSSGTSTSVMAHPVSTTSARKDATSKTSSIPTSASITIPSAKVTAEDMTQAVNETISAITSAKDKKPAPSSSAGTEAAPINSLSTTSSSTTAPTAMKPAKGTTVAVNDVVLAIKETSTPASDQKATDKKDITPEVSQGFAKPKVVEKVFDLPVVSDTYDSLVKLSSPLNPYVEKIGTLASPVVDQALEFRARIEDKVPEGVQTGYTTTLNKVVTAAVSLDATLCSGVDTLVEKVPALKQATPILYNSTRESVGSYATLVATYVASFTIAQVFLKAADLGLETTDGLLKLTANEKVDPILRGMRRVRSEASSLRKEGIVLNGTVKAKTLEEATLIGAMLEIFGLGSFFNQPGNSRDGAEEASLPEDEDAIDIVAMLPSKTRSGLVL